MLCHAITTHSIIAYFLQCYYAIKYYHCLMLCMYFMHMIKGIATMILKGHYDKYGVWGKVGSLGGGVVCES